MPSGKIIRVDKKYYLDKLPNALYLEFVAFYSKIL